MKELIKKYPNDQELGRIVRALYFEREDHSLELLKEVLSLHGFGGYGYPNGLVERGKYLETEDGQIRKWMNSCDGEMMNRIDQKIILFLNKCEND